MSRFARSYTCCSQLLWGLTLAVCLASTAAAEVPITTRAQGQSLVANSPQDPQAYVDYALWLVDHDQLETAAEVLEQGRTRAHASADLLVRLGVVYQAQGRLARAEATIRQALTLDADYLPAHLHLGEIYFGLGWPDSGVECFRKAVALAPDDSELRIRLVHALLDAEQVAAAEEQCLRYLAQDGQDAHLWLALGRVFEKQGRREQAFTTYGQALVLEPDLAAAYAHQGKLFAEFGQFDAALSACERALVLDPNNSLAHTILGISNRRLGRTNGADLNQGKADEAGMNATSIW